MPMNAVACRSRRASTFRSASGLTVPKWSRSVARSVIPSIARVPCVLAELSPSRKRDATGLDGAALVGGSACGSPSRPVDQPPAARHDACYLARICRAAWCTASTNGRRFGEHMTRIGIAGVTGRMGRLLVEQVGAAEAVLAGGLTRRGEDASGAGIRCFDHMSKLAAASDVVIDFTHADAARAHAEALAAAGTPWVLGTSGLSSTTRRRSPARPKVSRSSTQPISRPGSTSCSRWPNGWSGAPGRGL